MELEEYRSEFIDELRFNAEHDGTEPETQFINKMLENLEEIGELNDPYPMSVDMRGKRGRKMAFDAYAYDEADGSLILIASSFSNMRDSIPTLTNSQIDEMYKYMTNFIDVAKTEHSHPLGMVVSTHFRCGKGVKRGLKNGALPFTID